MAAQARFVRCPSCQWGTLADGNYCAYCGQPLRQAAAPPPAQAPAPQYRQQAPPQAQPGYGSTQQYYQQPGQSSNYYNPAGPQGSAYSGPQPHGPISCPNCGATNDPWLTHCKQCTRPLMATG